MLVLGRGRGRRAAVTVEASTATSNQFQKLVHFSIPYLPPKPATVTTHLSSIISWLYLGGLGLLGGCVFELACFCLTRDVRYSLSVLMDEWPAVRTATWPDPPYIHAGYTDDCPEEKPMYAYSRLLAFAAMGVHGAMCYSLPTKSFPLAAYRATDHPFPSFPPRDHPRQTSGT